MKVYIASSFRNIHGVRLLASQMRKMGYTILDWTEKATPPDGLNVAQRREWMDTDHGGEVFSFCAKACHDADFLIYYGTSGQDAGVEVGIAYGHKTPVLGIRGPLEAQGLMLHGSVNTWLENIDDALLVLAEIIEYKKHNTIVNICDFRLNLAQGCDKYCPEDTKLKPSVCTIFVPSFSGELCSINTCTTACIKKKLAKDLPKYSAQTYTILSKIRELHN